MNEGHDYWEKKDPVFEIGKEYRRKEIHELYGGQNQSGISTPRNYNVIFIFIYPQDNYEDKQDGDIIYYEGEGRKGDMKMQGGNEAIRDHVKNNKIIHVFKRFDSSEKGCVCYLGSAKYLGHDEEIRKGRKAIIFRLGIERKKTEIKKGKKMENIINILKYKNQIILQGPPGTGKTHTAKEIAEEMTKENEGQYEIIQFHPAYSYEDFVRGIVSKVENNQVKYEVENKVLANLAEKASNDSDNDYVLIIDEINRANLPAVLGELIYALEYRGEEVKGMYIMGGKREISLPKNLYIIGTMNTADRSVGHIDYAIRRRFAFIDVLPDVNKISNDKGKDLFKEVEKLFKTKKDENYEYLSPEFRWEEVQLGHSYFMAENEEQLKTKLKYEIKPILKEYLKDGVLLETARKFISGISR